MTSNCNHCHHSHHHKHATPREELSAPPASPLCSMPASARQIKPLCPFCLKFLPSVSAWQPLQPSVSEHPAAAQWPVQQLAIQQPAVLLCLPCASQLPHTPLQPLWLTAPALGCAPCTTETLRCIWLQEALQLLLGVKGDEGGSGQQALRHGKGHALFWLSHIQHWAEEKGWERDGGGMGVGGRPHMWVVGHICGQWMQ